MIDLHAHVLPGIDDGPRTLDDALALLRLMCEDGIRHVVATPHIYPGVFDNSPATILIAFERLRSAAQAEGLPITMSWGAEVRVCHEIIDWAAQGTLPLLGSDGKQRHVLVELPDGQIPVGTDRLLAMLGRHGIKALIAHPERNKRVMEQPQLMAAFVQAGCGLQVTAASLLGEFGSRAKDTARHLLDQNWVTVIASDAHSTRSRKPRMLMARDWLQRHYGAERALRLTRLTAASMLGLRLPSGNEAVPA